MFIYVLWRRFQKLEAEIEAHRALKELAS